MLSTSVGAVGLTYDSPRTCFVLGAGFSRAVFEFMPLLSDLRDEVIARLSKLDVYADGGFDLTPFRGDFEQWLSYLATDQPWLTPSENARNRALFYDVASRVHEVLVQREADALTRPCPPWLLKLARVWMATAATVATFNYDTLVERALCEAGWSTNWMHLYAAPVRTSPRRGDPTRMLSSREPTWPHAELVKLHGSVNWRYSGLDGPPSDEIVATEHTGGWDSGAIQPNAERPLLDGRQPLIVPPTGSKAVYYSNHALQAQWRHLAQTLRMSDELVVIGYSMPTTDSLVRAMVGTSFAGRRIVLVDRSDALAEALEHICYPAKVDTTFTGSEDVLDQYARVLPDYEPPAPSA